MLFCGCKAEPWLEVAQRLSPMKLSYWFGWDDDLATAPCLEKLGYAPYLHKFSKAWHGEGYPDNLAPSRVDEDLLNEFAAEELTALAMMDRLEPVPGTFQFRDRRRHWRSLLGKSLAILEAYKIDLVIAAAPPHRVFDYALYVSCNQRKIPYLSFTMTPFGPRSILIDHVRRLPKHVAFKYNESIPESSREQGSLLAEMAERIDAARGRRERSLPRYMTEQNEAEKRLLAVSNLTKIAATTLKELFFFWRHRRTVDCKVPDKSIEISEVSLLTYRWLQLREMQAAWRLKRSYRQFVDYASAVDLAREFVLVALHYQPEETTCPTGGPYCDQALAIEVLDAALPNNVEIVIKEHPAQFQMTLPGGRGRAKWDYEYMKRISPRVKFIAAEADAVELIDKAIAVATISGTIGWESAVRGTPAIIFGRAWYEGMPKVFKVTTAEEIRMQWPHIVRSKVNDDSHKITQFHLNLEKHLICAIHYKAFEGQFPLTSAQSRDAIVNGLNKYFAAVEL